MCSRPTALALAIAGIVSMGPAFGQDAPPPAAELEGVKVVGDWLGDATRNTVLDHPGARTVVLRFAAADQLRTLEACAEALNRRGWLR